MVGLNPGLRQAVGSAPVSQEGTVQCLSPAANLSKTVCDLGVLMLGISLRRLAKRSEVGAFCRQSGGETERKASSRIKLPI